MHGVRVRNVSDKSLKPSFLRTTAVKKPRTEWGCQPVAFMIVAIVFLWVV
jgi:hypothetical protein